MKTYLIKIYLLVIAITATFGAMSQIPFRLANEIEEVEHYIGSRPNPTPADLIHEDPKLWKKEHSWQSYLNFLRPNQTLIEWFKITAANERNAAKSLVLEVDQVTLRRVEVHVFWEGNLVSSRILERGEPDGSDRWLSSFFLTPLSIPAHSKVEILVRIETPRFAAKAPIRLHEERQELLGRMHRLLFTSLIVGGILGIMLYNLLLFLSLRNPTYLVYVAFHATIALYLFMTSGLIFIVIKLPSYDLYAHILNVSATMSSIIGTMFFVSFFRLSKSDPKLTRMIKKTMVLQAMLFLSMPILPHNMSAWIGHLVPLVSFVFYLVYIPSFAWRVGALNFIVSWTGLYAGTAVTILALYGVLPGTWLSSLFFVFGALWEAIFMTKNLADTVKRADIERQKLYDALATTANRSKLNEVFGQSYEQSRVLVQKNLSIMFISIDGFAEILRQKDAKKIFENLSEILHIIRKNVADHNGMIDRYLGDGILAVFGIQKRSDFEPSHVAAAFMAATQIQEEAARLIAAVHSHEKIPLPLKIGIHTDQIYIGNLGKHDRIDFTVIGDGVNFSSRLTHTCNPFRILLSASTKAALAEEFYHPDAMNSVSFRVKHQTMVFEGYEYDPLHVNPTLKREAESHHTKFLDRQTKEDRHIVPLETKLTLASNLGHFHLIDFSLNGLCAVSDRLIGQNLLLDASLEEDTGELKERLHAYFLDQIKIETRWSRAISPKQFKHGFRFCGLNDRQRQLIMEALQAIIQRRRESRKSG